MHGAHVMRCVWVVKGNPGPGMSGIMEFWLSILGHPHGLSFGQCGVATTPGSMRPSAPALWHGHIVLTWLQDICWTSAFRKQMELAWGLTLSSDLGQFAWPDLRVVASHC